MEKRDCKQNVIGWLTYDNFTSNEMTGQSLVGSA